MHTTRGITRSSYSQTEYARTGWCLALGASGIVHTKVKQFLLETNYNRAAVYQQY